MLNGRLSIQDLAPNALFTCLKVCGIPPWVTLATQIYLDIHDVLDEDSKLLLSDSTQHTQRIVVRYSEIEELNGGFVPTYVAQWAYRDLTQALMGSSHRCCKTVI
jgi:hypothetical protein